MVVPDVLEATSSEGGYKRTRGCNWNDGAITTVLPPWERYELLDYLDGSLRRREGIVRACFFFVVFFATVQLSYKGGKCHG